MSNQSSAAIAKNRLTLVKNSEPQDLAVARLARVVIDLNKGQGMTPSQIVGLVGIALKISNATR
jgi:hypothetical protein